MSSYEQALLINKTRKHRNKPTTTKQFFQFTEINTPLLMFPSSHVRRYTIFTILQFMRSQAEIKNFVEIVQLNNVKQE